MDGPTSQQRILDAAERLCQTRGFNGFSFRDLAQVVGIRSASVHYHFPTKSDLGKALIVRYRHRMESVFAEIERKEPTATARIRRFAGVLRELLRDENRLCLCGILAAEAGTLSEPMQEELRRFFDLCEAWLARELQEGSARGELKLSDAPPVVARAVLSALEGAMITSRAYGDPRRLEESTRWVLAQLTPA